MKFSFFKLAVCLILFCFMASSFAQTTASFTLETPTQSFMKVVARCDSVSVCKMFKKNLEKVLKTKKNKVLIKTILINVLNQLNNIKKFRYSFVVEKGHKQIHCYITTKLRIRKIKFKSSLNLNFIGIKKFLTIHEGSEYIKEQVKESKKILAKHLFNLGTTNHKIFETIIRSKEWVDVTLHVEKGEKILVKDVIFKTKNNDSIDWVLKSFLRLKNSIWNQVEVKVLEDKIRYDLLNQGYLFSDLDVEYEFENNNVNIKVMLDLGNKVNFYFRGNNILTRRDLLDVINSFIKKRKATFSIVNVINLLKESYRFKGLFNTSVTAHVRKGTTLDHGVVSNYYFEIEEGNKVQLDGIVYKGVKGFDNKFFSSLYNQSCSGLCSQGYLDLKYLDDFRKILKTEYLKNGFLYVDILKPKIVFLNNNKNANVTFDITERSQIKIKKINFNLKGIKSIKKYIHVIKNKKGHFFNVNEFENDLLQIVKGLKKDGYFFSEITNLNKENLIVVNEKNNYCIINVDLDVQKKTVLNDIVFAGLNKTKKTVVLREIHLKTGDLISPDLVSELKTKLLSLNIFSNVDVKIKIKRISIDDKFIVDLIVKIKESDYKIMEFAFGYRSDLGLKFSSLLSFNNLYGMDRDWLLNLQVNKRLSNNDLDLDRQQEDQNIFEYEIDTSFQEPYLFGWAISSDVSLSAEKKRFYSFDADIRKMSLGILKSFWQKKVSISLRYQLEDINQYDATDTKDSGYYRIGSINPLFALDLRNRSINPTSGLITTFSTELSNRELGSWERKNIDFVKFVLRTRLYIPFKEFVLASSLSIGLEKNNGSYIPAIKVFRLDGIDLVRGYSVYEINKLPSGQDISNYEITDRAYFTNFKLEPRYYLTDSTMLGVFFDAGNVYIDNYRPFELRTSVGVTFKLVTPIGSLDFDYGMKLNRLESEKFGRFHLSIGYF